MSPRRASPIGPGAWLLLLGLTVGCAGSPADRTPAALPGGPPPASGPSGSRDGGALSLVLENDVFAGSDDNYTNGVTVGYLSPPLASLSPSNLLRRYAELFPPLPGNDNAADSEQRYSVALVHSMYTPADISDPDPPLDDQPYAGVATIDQTLTRHCGDQQHAVLLRLGWVGPRTGAEEIQKWVHEVIGSREPQGWSTQLPDEGIVNLSYEVREVLGDTEFGGGFRADLLTNVAAHLGNFFTGANAGLLGRIGWNLPDALGAVAPHRGLRSEGLRCGDGPCGPGWRVGMHAGVEGFAIARYLPLDGTLFRDSRSVDDRAPYVGSATAGVMLGYGPVGLGFSFRTFTKTFASERTGNEYGTITLSWSF